MKKRRSQIRIVAIIALLSGCATTSEDVNDPYENVNRAIYSFNDTVDNVILRPVAASYSAVVPDPIERGVSNFFSNLNEITTIINDLLQFKVAQTFDDIGRFALNTTVGFAGIFDVAAHAGHKKNNEDFGQTLGVWGIKPGAYVVLPFLGPRTIRDSFGLTVDNYTSLPPHIRDTGTRDKMLGLQIIDSRANLLGVKKVLDAAALDEYIYVRDAYLQRRQNLVYDGNAPEEEFDVFEE